VISPYHEHSGNYSTLQMQSMGQNEVVIALAPNERLMRDLVLYKQTDKFIKQKNSMNQDLEVKKLLPEKGVQNQERYSDIKRLAGKLIGEAKMFVNGSELDIREGTDPRSRVMSAFHELIRLAYPNLRMLRGVVYSEGDIGRYLKSTGTLISDDEQQLNEAELELLAFIKSNQTAGIRTTLKNLIEHFELRPYGWYLAATLCTVAKLCARTKVEVRSDSNVLEDDDLVRALKNTRTQGNIVLEPQIEFSAVQVRKLKDFYGEFFDAPPKANEAKMLGNETADALQNSLQELQVLAAEKGQYPFLNVLNAPIDLLRNVSNKPYAFYLSELGRTADELLDIKEDVLDPVRRFMGGSMKSIYNDVRNFIQNEQHNFDDVEGDEITEIEKILGDVNCYKGSSIQQAKAHVQAVEQKIAEKLRLEKEKAGSEIEVLKQKLMSMSEFASLSESQKDNLLEPFERIQRKVDGQSLIAMIRDEVRRFEEAEYSGLLSQTVTWTQPKPVSVQPPVYPPVIGGKDSPVVAEPEPVPQATVEVVIIRNLKVQSVKSLLSSTEDVDTYIEKLRAVMQEEIRKGNRVQV